MVWRRRWGVEEGGEMSETLVIEMIIERRGL